MRMENGEWKMKDGEWRIDPWKMAFGIPRNS